LVPNADAWNARVMTQQLVQLLPLVAFFALLYVMMIRPQQVQQKKYREMLSRLKKGDRVITRGGLFAVVLEVKDQQLTLELAQNLKVRAERSAVQAVVNKGGTGA